MISLQPLVKIGTAVTRFALNASLPVEGLVRATVFDHFCGGVSEKDCVSTIDAMYSKNVHSVLDFSVEGKETESLFDSALERVMSLIDFAKDRPGMPFSVFKPTGFGRFEVWRKVTENETLSDKEQQEWKRIQERFHKVCKKAKACDINLLIPSVPEADPNSIVPTSSLLMSMSIGHCLAIATMNYRKFGKFDFKKFHPSGNLGAKLKTVEELMLKGNKVPFIRENIFMNNALRIMNKFNQGVLIVRNKNKKTLGIISDGDIKRISNKNNDIKKLITKNIMKKNPITVEKNMIAAEALSIMNSKKVTCLCVHDKKNQKKTLGIITIHNILNANIQ